METSQISIESSKKLASCNVYSLKVPNFFTLPGYKHGGFDMQSPSFEFEEATWCFRCISEEDSNTFSFELLRLKTVYSRHNLFFKIALFKANHLKYGIGGCGTIRLSKNASNVKLHRFENNCCSYHDDHDPLTVIVHLFPVETVEANAKLASSKKDSSHNNVVQDYKMSLTMTKKTVSFDFYYLKLPNLYMASQKIDNYFETKSPNFKFANATCCFQFRSHWKSYMCVSLEVLNAITPLQNIFIKCILLDDKDKVIGSNFSVIKFTKLAQKIQIAKFGCFYYPFLTLLVNLLWEEELEVDAATVPAMETRAITSSTNTSTESTSSTVSNLTPSQFDESQNVTISPSAISESSSAIHTSQSSSPTSNPGLLSRDLKELFLNGDDYDLTLRVAEKEFRVHRAILKARSEVFKAMLSHDMVEQNKGIIDIPDIDAQAMELLLIFVYSGEVDSLNEDNVLGLYYAADKYSMTSLKSKCSGFIKISLSTSIICDALQLALNHNDRDLMECCTEYFVNHVSDILPTVEWMSFMKSNVIAANELFIKANKK